MGQQTADQRVGTPAPVGKTGSVCNFNHNVNISANNEITSGVMNKGGTRPITTGTKAPVGRTGGVTKNS